MGISASTTGDLVAIAGPDMVVLRTPVELRGEGLKTVGDFVVSRGQSVPFVLTYAPSHLPLPEPIDPMRRCARPQAFWRMGEHLPSDRAIRRDRRTLADHLEGADLRAAPAASSPRRRPRCRSRSAARATGTIASAGCATRR